MRAFRLYLDTEAEVKWLNEMSEHGYKLKSFCLGVYTFEECEKGKYVYQEDTTSTFGRVSDEYREFMNDAEIEIVQVWGPWVILCREKDKGEFELFTDYESKIVNQKKILKIFKVVAIIELCCFFLEVYEASVGNSFAIYFAVIVGIFVFAFCRMIFITKRRINKLRAENGEIAVSENGIEIDINTGRAKRVYSPALMAGNVLYLCALCMNYEGSELKETVHMILLILACIFMLVGVFFTFYGTRDAGDK